MRLTVYSSSIGDGVTSALLLKPILRSHFALAFFARILKLYVFQLKVRLNIHISLTGMSHQMVSIFCARILNSHIAWHSRKITVA